LLSSWLALGIATGACGAPPIDFGADGGVGESPDPNQPANMSPDAGAAGMGGTFPVIPLPGAAGTGGGGPIGGGVALDGGVPSGGDGGAPGVGVGSAPAGAMFAITTAQRLLALDTESGAIASEQDISGIAAGDVIVGADFRPADRMLYALSRSGALYRIDVGTAQATALGVLSADASDTSAPYTALDGVRFGVDFNPVVDRLRVVSDTGQNLRINVDTAKVTSDTALNPGTPAVMAAAYSNAFAAACRTRLYGIDAAAGQLVVQDPPNDGKLTPIGALGVSGSLTGELAFDVLTLADGRNRALALLELDGVPTLFDVDLATGALSAPRTLGLALGESVVGMSLAPPLAAPQQAPGEILALSESQRLISFNRGAPGKLCTRAALSGLASNERVLGLDVRPADGALYALGSAGTIYTLDIASGAASLKSTLTADPTDTTQPYAGLSDAEYGAGFNPVPDRLRAIGSSGQNLRINVDTGATFTDGAIASPASIGAVAYTSAFAGAKSTTLFGIDADADALVRVGGDPATGGACPADAGNPNCGLLSSIGVLGLDASSVAGFDIDPKTGVLGSALVALSVEGTASSSLLVVDLDTGATSAPAGVANPQIGGGERVSALTLAQNPELVAYAVTSDAQLLAFSPRSPDQLRSQLDVSGLYDGDTLIGIDMRPADGLLYAVGSSGMLYTLDPTSGAATRVASLTAAAADDSPFSGFDARASHGVDFNPAADLLRVVSDWGQNLRVVPSARSLGTPPLAQATGATFTDLDLNPDFPSLLASAYTNAFAGAARTTLFGIDGLSDQLLRQGGPDGTPSPNTGTLTPIGSLGIDAIGDVAFDIAGGRNGAAIAIIESIDTPPSLYAVSLSTGAATPFNATSNIVGDGTLDVRGLALQLR
jgi:hypothetical protein